MDNEWSRIHHDLVRPLLLPSDDSSTRCKNKFIWKAGKKHYKYIINCLFTKPGHKISTITFTHRKLVDRDTGEKFSADSEKRLINESVSTFEDPDVEWPVE